MFTYLGLRRVYLLLAWFSDRPDAATPVDAGLRRFHRAAAPLIPKSYVRRQFGGRDWGVLVLHAPQTGAYRWPVVAEDGPVAAVSLGLPVGIDTTGGPVGLAKRLLAGEEIHATVVPPFTFIAAERDARVAIQQDWLGMGRLFTGNADGITAYCTRPSLVATFLGGTREPDVEGWLSYTASGQFGGDTSPIRGVRLMRPGERVTARLRSAGGWHLASEIRRCADDVVADGVAAQGRGLDAAVELAAEGMLATATSIYDLYGGNLNVGLSGGKDSRVIAAAFLAAGKPVEFNTNEDIAAEGTTARHLLDIVRDKRGLNPPHRVFRAGRPADVLAKGLYERTERLQRLYDFQFPSSYIERRAVSRQLPLEGKPTISGVGGEIAVAYWYPDDDGTDLDFAAGRRDRHRTSGRHHAAHRDERRRDRRGTSPGRRDRRPRRRARRPGSGAGRLRLPGGAGPPLVLVRVRPRGDLAVPVARGHLRVLRTDPRREAPLGTAPRSARPLPAGVVPGPVRARQELRSLHRDGGLGR